MRQDIVVERLRQELTLLLEYLAAVEVPDFQFVRDRTSRIASYLDDSQEQPLRWAA